MLCSAALDFWRELSDLNPRHFIIKIFHVFQISTHENEFPHYVTPIWMLIVKLELDLDAILL